MKYYNDIKNKQRYWSVFFIKLSLTAISFLFVFLFGLSIIVYVNHKTYDSFSDIYNVIENDAASTRSYYKSYEDLLLSISHSASDKNNIDESFILFKDKKNKNYNHFNYQPNVVVNGDLGIIPNKNHISTLIEKNVDLIHFSTVTGDIKFIVSSSIISRKILSKIDSGYGETYPKPIRKIRYQMKVRCCGLIHLMFVMIEYICLYH